MFIHNIIKIHLIKEGYLPDYPYHLISDAEMLDAFMSDVVFNYDDVYPVIDEKTGITITWAGIKVESGKGYFFDNYPVLDEDYSQEYADLTVVIKYFIDEYKSGQIEELPPWIYSYMLGEVISVNSDKLDIHDLIAPIGLDNLDDTFTKEAQVQCYRISKHWVAKLPDYAKTHTMFDVTIGEEHITRDVSERPATLFGEAHVIKSIRLMIADPINYSVIVD